MTRQRRGCGQSILLSDSRKRSAGERRNVTDFSIFTDGQIPLPAVLRWRWASEQHGGKLPSSPAAQGSNSPRLLPVMPLPRKPLPCCTATPPHTPSEKSTSLPASNKAHSPSNLITDINSVAFKALERLVSLYLCFKPANSYDTMIWCSQSVQTLVVIASPNWCLKGLERRSEIGRQIGAR